MMSRLTSVIYPSLPPYVSGEATGELILSSGRLQLSNIPSPHLAHISFKWWGQHEDPVILQYGKNAKAIFPLRTDLSSLQTYLADMHELKIDVYQSDELLGFSTIPLRHIINTKVNAEVTCPIKSKSRNTSIGHFTLRFVAKYRNTTTTPITKIDLTSTTPTKSEKKISDFSRVEALVVTDNSNKFPEWPQHKETMRHRQNHNFQPERAIPQGAALSSASASRPVISKSVRQQALRAQAEQRVLPNTPLYNEASFDTHAPPTPLPPPPEQQQSLSIAPSTNRSPASPKRQNIQKPHSTSPSHPQNRPQLPTQPAAPTSSGVASILDAAEGLLSRIKQSRSGNAERGPAITPNAIADMLEQSPALKPLSLPKLPPPMLTQIDWLLRGVPEAYDDTYIDDETLDRIINGCEVPLSDDTISVNTTSSARAIKTSNHIYEADMLEDALTYVPNDWYMRKPVLSAPQPKSSDHSVTSNSTLTTNCEKTRFFREVDVQTSIDDKPSVSSSMIVTDSLECDKKEIDRLSCEVSDIIKPTPSEELGVPKPTPSDEPVVPKPQQSCTLHEGASSIDTHVSIDSLFHSMQSLGTQTTLEGRTDMSELPMDSLDFQQRKPLMPATHETSHILEIVIEGRFDALLYGLGEPQAFQDCLGCYCHYSFPGLSSENESWHCDLWSSHEAKKSAMLWWDSECAVLNSRNHHQFTVKDGENFEDVLGITAQQCVTLSFYPADMEGSFDKNRFLGTANLSKLELLRILEQAGCARSMRLPVTASSRAIGEVNLHISHRIIPVAIRSELIKSISSSASSECIKGAQGRAVSSESEIVTPVADDSPVYQSRVENCVRISVQIDDVLLEEGENATTFVFTCGSKLSDDSKVSEHFVSPPFAIEELPSDIRQIDILLNAGQNKLRSVDLIFSLYSGSYSNVLFGNICLGSVVVDLSPLAIGFGKLHGWYHIIDAAQRTVGQMLVQIGYEAHDGSDVVSSCMEQVAAVKECIVSEVSCNLNDISTDLDLSSQVARLIEQLSSCNDRLVGSFLMEDDEEQVAGDVEGIGCIFESIGQSNASCSTVTEEESTLMAQTVEDDIDDNSAQSLASMLSRDFYDDESLNITALTASIIEPEIVPMQTEIYEDICLPVMSDIREIIEDTEEISAPHTLNIIIGDWCVIAATQEVPYIGIPLTPRLTCSPILIPDVAVPLPILAPEPAMCNLDENSSDTSGVSAVVVDGGSDSPCVAYSDDFEESVEESHDEVASECSEENNFFIEVQATIAEEREVKDMHQHDWHMPPDIIHGFSDNSTLSHDSDATEESIAHVEAMTSTSGLVEEVPIVREDFSCQVDIMTPEDCPVAIADDHSLKVSSSCISEPVSVSMGPIPKPVLVHDMTQSSAATYRVARPSPVSSEFDAIAKILENTMKAEHISWDNYPGQRRRFADKETERISRIMLGKKLCRK